jgi:hypothetical protein
MRLLPLAALRRDREQVSQLDVYTYIHISIFLPSRMQKSRVHSGRGKEGVDGWMGEGDGRVGKQRGRSDEGGGEGKG